MKNDMHPAPKVGGSLLDGAPYGAQIIGVLGGMGPAATADFYTKLVAECSADADQEHPQVVLWSDSSIPDRTRALAGVGLDPSPWLLRGADFLRRAGASFIVVPCNTAHAFLPRVLHTVDVELLDMIETVGKALRKSRPRIRRVGLLATTGTVEAALYQKRLAQQGIEVLLPTARSQELVMAGIRGVKEGKRDDSVRGSFILAAERLVDSGAEVVIGGCTEVPLVLNSQHISAPLLDPTQVLARAAVERACS